MAWLASAMDVQSDADFALVRYLTAPRPDFSLSFAQLDITASRGTKISVTVNIGRIGGLAGSVTVMPPAQPPKGVKVKGGAMSTKGNAVTFPIKIKASAAPGSYQLVFSGTDSAGQMHDATLTLTIQ